MKNIEIRNQDFSVVIKECKPGDVVYMDPPYDKINEQSFIEYNVSTLGTIKFALSACKNTNGYDRDDNN